MPEATPHRRARHRHAHPVLIVFLQCICVVTLFSTGCYIVDIRLRYSPKPYGFHAITQYSKLLWNASSLPSPPGWPASAPSEQPQARDEPLPVSLNASFARTGAAALPALYGYGLERTGCLWPVWPDAAVTTTATRASLIASHAHLHIFFLHGNAGSHNQGEYWSCAIQYVSDVLGVNVSTYAFQWAEQANVHRGRLVGLQADYVADVVETVVRDAPDHRVEHRVWLVAHSMGGVVARLAAQLLDPSIDVGGIVAFNSPHRFPPLLLDAPMADVYRTLAFAEQSSAAFKFRSTKEAAITAGAVSGAESPRRLSSVTLMEVCGALTEGCLRHRRRQRRVPHLISITSGEMDLQIEPATTYPSQWSSRYAVSFFNILDRDVCASTASHDGILMDPCAVTLGALRLLSSSLHQVDGTVTPAETEEGDLANGSARAQLPLPPGIVSRVSLFGQLLWQQHMWPWAVSALYGYVLFGGLWPQFVQSAGMLSQRWSTRRGRVHLLASMLRWIVSRELSATVFLVYFYGCTCLYATLTELCFVGAGQRAWYGVVQPWQWEVYPQLRHTSARVVAPVQFVAFTLFFLLTSVGPVTAGINAGMALMVMGDVTQSIKARVGRCWWRLGMVRLRRATAVLFPVVLVILYIVLLSIGVGPTARAITWVVLFSLVPNFRQTQARQEDRSVTPAAADVDASKHEMDAVEVVFPADLAATTVSAEVARQHAPRLPGVLYAALYMIQLHPFFTLRNALVSSTFDNASTVDARNYVMEVGLLLLCCAAAAPALPACRLCVLSYYGPPLSSVVSVSAIAWMLVRPVESFQVLPALLWCFPSFLFLALSP